MSLKNKETKILIMVDMQNGFLKDKEKLKKRTEKMLGYFDYVIATKFINTRSSIYEKLSIGKKWQLKKK